MVGGVVLLAVVGMPGVGIIGRNHKGTLDGLVPCFGTTALCEGDALQHHGQERTASTLLGLRARLLVVENGQHLGGIGCIGINHGLKSGKAHRQIVEATRRQKLIVYTKRAGWGGVGQIQVEVEYLLGLDAEFAADDIHEQISLFEFIVDNAQDGEHIPLLAELDAIVYLTVEMDGEVADLQQRTFYVQQQCLRVEGILATHNHSTCDGEWTIEPG